MWYTWATAEYEFEDEEGRTSSQLLVAFQSRKRWTGGVRRRVRVIFNSTYPYAWNRHPDFQSDIVQYMYHNRLPHHCDETNKRDSACKVVIIDGKVVA